MNNLRLSLRRFEGQSASEIALRYFLPKSRAQFCALSSIDHFKFDLSLGGGFSPADNLPHQRGLLEGFWIEQGAMYPGSGAMQVGNGALILDSFFDDITRSLACSGGYLKKFPKCKGKNPSANLGLLYSNYYHRWADSIPRIYSLWHPAISSLGTIDLYIDRRFSEDEVEVIKYLLPSYVNLKCVSSATRVFAPISIHLPYMSSDRVAYSKWFHSSAGFLPREVLDWIRVKVIEYFSFQCTTPFRRLYISRQKARHRRLKNENAVQDYLLAQGFEILFLEEIPLREQVKKFYEASVVLGQHGAGLVNLIFSQEAKVIEILSGRDAQIYFSLLSKSRCFPHYQIRTDAASKNADIEVPINDLALALERIGVD